MVGLADAGSAYRPAGTLNPPLRFRRNRPLKPVRFRKMSMAASAGAVRPDDVARALARAGLKRRSRTS